MDTKIEEKMRLPPLRFGYAIRYVINGDSYLFETSCTMYMNII